MSSNSDSLLLQSLMDRLQLSPFEHSADSNLEHLLSSVLNPSLPLSSSSSNAEGDSGIAFIATEESKVEREIVRVILAGDTDSLRPNSGQPVTIAEHSICVGCHWESGPDYRVWEWHGHIMAYDELNGYSLEYIYGNYFERLPPGERGKRDEESSSGDLGLRGLIADGKSGNGRILRRNVNVDSQRSNT